MRRLELSKEPPQVPAEFWDHPPLAEALAARHMGRVLRTYRLHPWHGRHGVPQSVAGEWLRVTQAQISRWESGGAGKDLDWLTFVARTLRIPRERLWFAVDDDPGPAAERAGAGAAQRQFGADLRHWRTVRGWRQRDLAEGVVCSREFVAMVERGAGWPTEDLARRADAVLATGGVLLSRWPAVEAERMAVMPSLQPRPLARVLPLRCAEPDPSGPDAPVTGDPLAAMVIDVLRACPGARVVVFAVDGDGTGSALAGDGDRSAAVVVDLANVRTGTVRRRTSGRRS